MSKFKPLVVDPAAETAVQQIQGGADLDIPLEKRFQKLKRKFDCLVLFMLSEKFNLPDELIGDDLWT